MKIGELARQTGLNASAIRYYERCGLLSIPNRVCGQRRYSEDSIHRLLLVRFASHMGFSLGEIRIFLAGLRESSPVGPRWRKLAHRKIKEVNASIQRSRQLRSLLEYLLQCNCGSAKACVELLRLSPVLARSSKPWNKHRIANPPPRLPRRLAKKARNSVPAPVNQTLAVSTRPVRDATTAPLPSLRRPR